MASETKPLADKLRPDSMEHFVGQKHLLSENGIINIILKNKIPVSLLFFGPPGVGKTTLAEIIAGKLHLPVIKINGISFSTQTFKKIVQEMKNSPVIIIIDEIHRMNKLQQDALLPYVENGNVLLIGTTTENPSFEINNALLSRLNTIVFEPLKREELEMIIQRAADYLNIEIKKEIAEFIVDFSNNDARQAINIIDVIKNDISKIENVEHIKKILTRKFVPHDKDGEEHYNLISAFHKSVRGSDVNASLYYFARMIFGGEDPLYIARRMIRIASEDIGNADHNALAMAVNAYKAYSILGSPEGELALAQCAVYLALAPKSVGVYNAFSKVKKDMDKHSGHKVPLKLRNAPTEFMKNIGYSDGYRYPPDYENSFIDEKYFPDDMPERKYYEPVLRGFERELKKRMDYFEKLRQELKKKKNGK